MSIPDPSPISLTPEEDKGALELSRPPKGPWRETAENLLRTPSAVVGMTMLGFLMLVALLAPVISPYNPTKKLLDIPEEGVVRRAGPCIHLLGCPKAGDTIISIPADAEITSVQLIEERLLLSYGNKVEVWRAENAERLFTLTHDAPINAAAWRSDQAILTASGNRLYIWKERAIIQELEVENTPQFVLWNADGTRFVSATATTVDFWLDCSKISFAPSCTGGTKSWVDEGRAELPGEWVAIQWHPDRPELMVASANLVQIWDSTAGIVRVIRTYEHEEPITSATYSKRGGRILTTSGNTLQTWQSGSPYERLQIFTYSEPLYGGSWSEQTLGGKEVVRVAAVSGNTLVIWDTQNGEILQTLSAGDESLVSANVSPLATQYMAYSQNTVYVWDASDENLVFSAHDDSPLKRVSWRLPNGGNLIVYRVNATQIVKTTNFQYILGIDGGLRDQFSRLVYGARVSLAVGVLSVTLAIIVGTMAGLIAGFVGGWTDNIIMRIMDVMLAFPSLILAIAVVTILEDNIARFLIDTIPLLGFLDPGLVNALIAISVVFVPAYARIARSGVLSVKEYDFIEAYRALGATPGRILFRRVLPNVLAPLIVQATLGIGTAILDAAALSFLGLGAQPPIAEWGRMLSEERAQFQTAPHLVLFPGLAIMITVLAFNLLGDGLRDALDPRLNR